MVEKIRELVNQLNKVIIGNEKQVLLAVICLLAKGNLLIEDLPGTGKTTLARALAKSFGLKFKNVHFTNDLLPSDLIGVNIFDSAKAKFNFEAGPIFTNILLADEINRASPRTQSALLEAMNEEEINVEGKTKKLPEPFFVIASQNPLDQIGTSPLPESQLDRFLMRISIGNPSRSSEKRILKGENIKPNSLSKIISKKDLISIQKSVDNYDVSNELYEYILDLIEVSRKLKGGGFSTRAALGLLRAAKACAFVNNEDIVLPDHVQFVFYSTIEHRLDNGYKQENSISEKILHEVNAVR